MPSRTTRRQRRRLRRPRQRLARRRHRPRHAVGRLRQRPAAGRRRPLGRLHRLDPERDLHRVRHHLAERRARHAPDVRGSRVRRRRSRRPDREHRRRPPDRLGRRVQQLHRPVRAVRDRDRQPPGAARRCSSSSTSLSKAQGADPTRAADTNIASAPRNGEPNGEIGLVTQKDHGLWQKQTGAPADPQAGNIPGGKRDVLRTRQHERRHAAPASRSTAASGRSPAARSTSRPPRSARTRPRSSTSTRSCPSTTSSSPRCSSNKPTGGWKANAYVIFDYFSPTDFKFAGIDVVDSTRSVSAIARRRAGSSTRPASCTGNVRDGHLLRRPGRSSTAWSSPSSINGVAAAQHPVRPALHRRHRRTGSTWASSASARTTRAAPSTTSPSRRCRRSRRFENTDDFADGAADLFTGEQTGTWSVGGGRYAGAPAGGSAATSVMTLPVRARRRHDGRPRRARQARRRRRRAASSSTTTTTATSSTSRSTWRPAQVVIGHRIKNRLVVDAAFAVTLAGRRRLQARGRL